MCSFSKVLRHVASKIGTLILFGLGHILPFYIHYIGYLNMYKEIDIPEHMHIFKCDTDA